MGKYDTLSLKDIRRELANRGARQSGRKKELIERLESYDRNFNFQVGPGTSGATCKYEMSVPDAKTFRDLTNTASFPKLTKVAVDAYLSTFDASLKAGNRIYDSRFLQFVRLSVMSQTYFFKSQCRAEMKKSVIYNIDLKISREGAIEEAQCECAAGMGPDAHCKHVCALLCGVLAFSAKGQILTEETCTSQLQTFNKPKKLHHGSPVKSNKIQLGKRAKDAQTTFDPRPTKYVNMEGYNSYVRNLTINYAFTPKIPLLQTYAPANPYALNMDHDYEIQLGSDTFLELVNVTKISSNKIKEIEKETKEQSMSSLWSKERQKRITFSNFGRVCKLSAKSDARAVAKSFILPPNLKAIKAIKHGRKYEGVAIEAYSEIKGVQVLPCGLCISESHPYLAATPDGKVGLDKIIEVKCPYSAKDSTITAETVPYLNQDESNLVLDKNHNYHYQIQGQLMITGAKSCDLIVYTLKDMKIINVLPDAEFQRAMLDKLKTFFNEHYKPTFLDINYYHSYYDYTFKTK